MTRVQQIQGIFFSGRMGPLIGVNLTHMLTRLGLNFACIFTRFWEMDTLIEDFCFSYFN